MVSFNWNFELHNKSADHYHGWDNEAIITEEGWFDVEETEA